jgi:hypothetical protein
VRRPVATAVLAIASLAASLAAAEIGVRIVYRELTTTSPIESWFGLRWKREELRRNRYGFRDGEFSVRKPAGTTRVIAVGDSFTAAMGIAEDERYTERLEAALRSRRGPAEVLNFANPGAEIDDHVETLRRAVLPAAPDFILLQWYVNDFEIDKRGHPRTRHLVPFRAAHAALFAHSAFYALLDQQWAWLQVRLGLTPSYEDYMRERYADPAGEGSRRAMQELHAFLRTAKEAGVPVAVVLFPHLDARMGADDPFATLDERVCEACAEESVPCIDLREVFSDYADRIELLRVNRFDHHASAHAHRLAAERLLEVLGPVWWGLSTTGSVGAPKPGSGPAAVRRSVSDGRQTPF